MEAREQSSTVSLAYREKTNQEVLSLMVFITEFRQQFSVPFSSSEQHFGIIYPVTLIQKKKRLSSHRGMCSSYKHHICTAALPAQAHLDQRELDNFQPNFSSISYIQPSVLSPVNAEGRKAANRGSRLRTVIWIKEFLLVLHLRTHWHT